MRDPRALSWLLALAGCAPPPADYHAVGMLEWDRIELVAEQSEPIVALPVGEGATVDAGAIVVELDPRRTQARLDAARAERDREAARVAELERGPRHEMRAEARARRLGADEVLAVRERELKRVTDMVGRRLVSPEDVDRARAARDAARAERDAARAVLAALETGTTREELDQSRHALQRSEAEVRRLETDLARLRCSAPRSAYVDDLPFEIGEQPRAGEVVAVLLDAAQPYARVYVPERIRVHVQVGTSAEIRIDGLAEAISGHVRKISAEPAFTPYLALNERDRGRLTYVAEIAVDSAARRLPAGVPLQVRFPGIANAP